MTSAPRAGSRRIVVLGGGFGGLTFCQNFPAGLAAITLVDRTNHHLFQPLLYQVATAGLSAPDIAQPIRSILTGRRDIDVRMESVTGVDLGRRRVLLGDDSLEYDSLILALGGVTSYFGHEEWAAFAPGLKSLDDALRVRRSVLLAFEAAEVEPDPARRIELMTIVVVGGGPTGVELAGAFAELARNVLARDFGHIDPRQARIVLVEGAPRVLARFPERLSASAHRQLRSLGVEVMTACPVKAMRPGEMELPSGTLRAGNIIWAAGVAANPLARTLGVDCDRSGRIQVLPDLSLPGHPEVFAVGDIAALVDAKGVPVPGISPAAMQMARHAARIVAGECRGRGGARPAFAYWDKGTMATIGRSRAVAMIGPVMFSGYLAWLAWLVVHLVFLVGFRNRISVLLNWTYSYLTYKRGARIIFGPSEAGPDLRPARRN